jgi:hypothetical protein
MAKAVRSLSPKQIQERIQQHRQAVMIVALMRAKKAINAKLRAEGVRLTCVLPAVINAQARDYLAQHREQLIAEAEHAIATWPGFARWRLPDRANLLNDAQKQSEPKSTTSAVHNSGAK